MPGGRLTLDERRQIAAGLDQGLGYADIGRPLGRPTSTISREVNRNGGHNGYRAERADRAAIRRAARGRAQTEPPPHTPPDTDVVDPDDHDKQARLEFERRFRQTMTETGFPHMMARVLIALYLSDSGTLTSAELVTGLQVSPASVSKAISYLERLDFVRREKHPTTRRELYVIDATVWERAWHNQALSMARWAATVREGTRIYGPDTTAGDRLYRLDEFFTFHHHELLDSLDRWRQHREGRDVPAWDSDSSGSTYL